MPELEALATSAAVPFEVKGGLASKEGKANLLIQARAHTPPAHIPHPSRTSPERLPHASRTSPARRSCTPVMCASHRVCIRRVCIPSRICAHHCTWYVCVSYICTHSHTLCTDAHCRFTSLAADWIRSVSLLTPPTSAKALFESAARCSSSASAAAGALFELCCSRPCRPSFP